MVIKEKEEKGHKREPSTKEEMDKLESQLKLFPQRKIAGKLRSPFDQYMCSINVRKIVGGEMVCVQTTPDWEFCWVNQHLELRQQYQTVAQMNNNPAKRAAHEEMLKKFWPSRSALAHLKEVDSEVPRSTESRGG